MRNDRRHGRDDDREREGGERDEERNGRSAGSRQYGEYQGEEYRDVGLSRGYGEDVESDLREKRAETERDERDRKSTAPSSEQRTSPDPASR